MTTTTQMTIRTLPLRAAIAAGESVDSWIEHLARRYRITPRALLPALGITQTTPATRRLIYGIDPQIWRRVEHATGLAAGCLDAAVGDSIAVVSRLRSGGSRYCPRCLADDHSRWQLSWRLNWTIACLRHRVVLCDSCPACHTTPRTRVTGGTTPTPPANCAHIIKPARRRCGTDLSTATVIPASADVLDAQRWIDQLLTELGGTGGHDAATVFTDLPIVVAWLLRHDCDAVLTAANAIHPDHVDTQAGHQDRPSGDAALTAAVLTRAKTLLDHSDEAAIAMVRDIVSRLPTRTTIPPIGISVPRWQAMTTRFPNRYLRAADPDLLATERLRMKTVTPTARHPRTEVCGRVRKIPQMLWPDWSGRLLPVTGFQPELFRAAFSISLLIPGHPDRDLSTLAARLNTRVSRASITVMFQQLADQLGGPILGHILTVLCRISDYLDEVGSPIDYQRRREQIPTETITWPQWRDLACSAGAHPGEHRFEARHVHAQRHLHQLLSGADLADRRHPLAFRNPGDRSRYVDFTIALTPPLRRALDDHATTLLADLGIDEPLTWSPPADLAHGHPLPGIDTDELDTDTISRLVVAERRPLREAAQALGVHIEHIRIASKRLDRPPRQWAKQAAPSAWLREQQAAQLFTRDFFDREHLHRGRTLTQIAQTTGFGRHIVARFANQVGITPTKGRPRFPIDSTWLREQYCHRRRSTADIAAELGTEQMIVNNALHRLGISPRPPGVASFPQMIAVLDDDVPPDIRIAVEGTLHSWQRLHRFQIAMTFPNLETAGDYLGADHSALVSQFQRLERDIGKQLFHRASYRTPHRPTPPGQTLLRDLHHDRVQTLMHAALRDNQAHPMPDATTLADAHHKITTRHRKPALLTPFNGITVDRLRRSRPLLTLLRDLIDHDPEEFYGLTVKHRTGIDDGTLYPLLKRMNKAGWLTSRPEDEQSWLAGAPPGCGPGRRRTYYTLTAEGRRAARHELDRHATRLCP